MTTQKRIHLRLLVATAAVITISGSAFAYKLSPRASAEERRLAGITSNYWTDIAREAARLSLFGFSDPVHEEITNRMFGCEGDKNVCGGASALTAPAPVLAGVRWNDDPPFRLSPVQAKGTKCKTAETVRFETQPSCWVALFRAAEKGASQGETYGPGDAMLYRTHFGDLQFLHAMASKDGEPASETKAKLMDWFEFTWRAGLGEYTLDTRLKEIHIPTVEAAFGKTDWRMLDLYTQGAGGGLRRELDDVAFGSLLHAVQDSFAAGHVDREVSSGTQSCTAGSISVVAPGAIRSFHAYNHQDHSLHGQADTRAAFDAARSLPGNVVQIGRGLVEARDKKLNWEDVRPLFDCLVTLQEPTTPAGAGDDFVSVH